MSEVVSVLLRENRKPCLNVIYNDDIKTIDQIKTDSIFQISLVFRGFRAKIESKTSVENRISGGPKPALIPNLFSTTPPIVISEKSSEVVTVKFCNIDFND